LSGQQRAQILLNLFRLVWTAARARLPGKRAQGCRASVRKAAGQARARLPASARTFAISILRPISTGSLHYAAICNLHIYITKSDRNWSKCGMRAKIEQVWSA
jgi:hypothetical protein